MKMLLKIKTIIPDDDLLFFPFERERCRNHDTDAGIIALCDFIMVDTCKYTPNYLKTRIISFKESLFRLSPFYDATQHHRITQNGIKIRMMGARHENERVNDAVDSTTSCLPVGDITFISLQKHFEIK